MTRGRWLCAWVVEPAHRLCQRYAAYTDWDGRHWCAQHARTVGADVPMQRPRRELYRIEPNRTRSFTVPFYADATAQAETLEPDTYTAVVDHLEEFQGTKYQSDEPQLQAKIVWRIKGGEYDGKTVDRIVSPSLNEKATLYPFFKAITGKVPEPGKRYDLEAELVGKPCRIVVEDYTNTRGSTFSRVATVLPPRKPKQIVVDDDADMLDA